MSGSLFHAPFIEKHAGFELVGCWERSAKRINAHYPSVRSYETLEELLGEDAIDLVLVNTPTYTHYEYAKKALQSGKHLVVEKTFVGDADEARELRDLATKAGRKLSVFQNRRWDSDFQSVRQVIRDGVLGEIVEANLGYCRFDPNLSPKIHKEDPDIGSGAIKDIGAHVIDQALVLFGMPEGVFADIGVTRPHSRVDDYFDILLMYPDKRVHVKGGYFYKQPVPEYTFFGMSGCFLKRRADVQEQQLDDGMTPADSGYGVEPDGWEGRLYVGDATPGEPELIRSPTGNYMEFYDGVYESITGGHPEPVSADDGVRVMRIIDAAFRSHREGKVTEP
jgi:predicted dehydrogenase